MRNDVTWVNAAECSRLFDKHGVEVRKLLSDATFSAYDNVS